MSNHTHPLFQRFPLQREATISTGNVPTPYHIYDGYGAFIGGTADMKAVQTLLANEQVEPIRTQSGRALMGIWVCNFEEASLGAHHELQFSIFVTRSDVAPLQDAPLALLAAMLNEPHLEMMCHKLWNNTPVVVAYNRELLSLDAHLSSSHIERQGNDLQFDIREAGDNAPVLQGSLSGVSKPSLSGNMALMRLLGLRKTFAVTQQPVIEMSIVHPVGVGVDRNGIAKAYTKTDANNIHLFKADRDRLQFGANPYGELDFKPQFSQYMTGFKFVYLAPS